MSWVRIPPNPCEYIHVIYNFWTTLSVDSSSLLSDMLSPFQNFKYALKSKDVQRQYPAMLLRFLDFIGLDGNTEQKCNQLCKLAEENSALLQSYIMKYCYYQKDRIQRSEIAEGTLRNYLKAVKLFFEMNDIVIPWKKITRGLPTPSRHQMTDVQV